MCYWTTELEIHPASQKIIVKQEHIFDSSQIPWKEYEVSKGKTRILSLGYIPDLVCFVLSALLT